MANTYSVLVIGSGGREHALAWKLQQSPAVNQVYIAPGNAGSVEVGTNVAIAADDIDQLLAFAKAEEIFLTVVGPEVPLAAGIVDAFEAQGLKIFGPTRAAAQLETSKAWTADFLEQYAIPHPVSRSFTDAATAKAFVEEAGTVFVVKASGLAAGKGVIVPETMEETLAAIDQLMIEHVAGAAGQQIVLQEKLSGQEVSLLALTDGKTIVPLLPAQDHKRIFDHDQGPNTGGMGVYAPTPFASPEDILRIQESILQPAIDGMADQGIPYKGLLYAGLMMTPSGPQVIEFNARFGDPETQPLMMLLESDLFELLLACVEGRLTPEMVSFKQGSAVCVILAAEGYPGPYAKGVPIAGLDREEVDPDIQVFHAGTSFKAGTVVSSGGRVLAVTAWDETLFDALRKVYGAIGTTGIHFDGMQYRTDIGNHATS